MNTQKRLTCLRCGASWLTWLERPAKCSSCRSPDWDKPIRQHEKSERMRAWWKQKKSAPLG